MILDHYATRAAGQGARPWPQDATGRDDALGSAGEHEAVIRERSLAHLVHELRTPLNVVLGYLALLREGTAGALPPRADEMIGRIGTNARHLRELVDEVLELTRLNADRVRLVLENVAVEEHLRDVVASLEPDARARGLALVVRTTPVPRVCTDARRFRQIVLNLVANAIKFTERGEVIVRVESRESSVAVHVADTGIGIAPEDLERVFMEFEQVSGARGGTGLGLAISRRLARLLGGEITVRSQRGRGSCFTLMLPTVQPNELRVRTPDTARQSRSVVRPPVIYSGVSCAEIAQPPEIDRDPE